MGKDELMIITQPRSHLHQPLLPFAIAAFLVLVTLCSLVAAQEPKHSNKPPIHGKHWVAVTGKPLAATAGSMIFAQGGNAVDAAAAMLAAAATMWDTLGWGGETQALIHDPNTGKVHAINALGVAPSGATPDFFRALGMDQPPDFGPLAAITPGTPGGLLVMLAEFGTMSLAEVLAPAMQMAEGYPIEQIQAEDIENNKFILSLWPDSRRVLLPNFDSSMPNHWAAPRPGQNFQQRELLATLEKLVLEEREALAAGKSRQEAIMAAYDRFYRGDIAEEIVRASQAHGGLFTMEDLDQWQVHIEEPVMTTYKGIEVYKLNHWVQGPVLLQMLNMLEDMDLQIMGYNSARYIHTLYQVMNLGFADRDFYYGDPYHPPYEPIQGLLSKEYARERAASIDWTANQPLIKPGDPYPYQQQQNPYLEVLERWQPRLPGRRTAEFQPQSLMTKDQAFLAGTTSIQAVDAEGWMVSITPSGGWIPAFIAGSTGIGLSQRMQSFDMDPDHNPFNVLAPGKRPRATLTPSLALKNGKPFMAFGVQGGDSQEQNLLQFFLNIVEFGMDVQQATEAANFNSFQMHSSFGQRHSEPGRMILRVDTPRHVIQELSRMGYSLEFHQKTSGPITGIMVDQQESTLWGGASDFGDDYGIGW
jgi:gamma-glutamyltranspeptidase / glutathione hydrolase